MNQSEQEKICEKLAKIAINNLKKQHVEIPTRYDFCPIAVESIYYLIDGAQQLETETCGGLSDYTQYVIVSVMIDGDQLYIMWEGQNGCCSQCDPDDGLRKEAKELYQIDPDQAKKLIYDDLQDKILCGVVSRSLDEIKDRLATILNRWKSKTSKLT